MRFQSGSLPWDHLDSDSTKKWSLIGEKKSLTPVEEICRGCAIEFNMYLHYCRGLRFDETPDYQYLRKLFNNLFHRLRLGEYDWKFDWTIQDWT